VAQSEKPRRSWRERLRQNPVLLKEVRGRMRGRRAFVSLTIYLLFLSSFVSLIYLSGSTATNAFGSPSDWQRLGKAVFVAVVGLELFMVCFIAPGVTAGSISSERERLTFDVLRTTLLSARALVLGKLASALSYLFLLLIAAIPLQSLAFLFGGVTPEEVLIGAALLVMTAITFSALGLYCSSLTRRTQVSTVLAYILALLFTIGLPLMLAVLLSISMRSYLVNSPGDSSTLIALYWLVLSISPLGAGIVTELMLASSQSIFYFNLPISGNNTLNLIAPWIIYLVAHVFITLALIGLSIRNVRRPEK